MSDTAPVAPAPGSAASHLCTQCGLCCDGTIFDRAKVYPADLPALAAHGIAVFEGRKGPAFALPCPRLDGACCTIYPDRFTTCRRFRCEVLMKLDAGAIDLAQASATVATAHALVAAVEPAARVLAYRFDRDARVWADIADPGERTAAARRHLAVVALERFLDAHFRHPKKDAPAP